MAPLTRILHGSQRRSGVQNVRNDSAIARRKKNRTPLAVFLLITGVTLCVAVLPLFYLFRLFIPRVFLTNQFSELPVDEDGNGRYEYLTVQVEVNAIVAGHYSITADLTVGGRPVAHTGTSTSLSSGLNVFTLEFSGDSLRISGVNGPYTLTHLSFLETEMVFFPTSFDDVWTTHAHNVRDFGVCYSLSVSVDPPLAGNVVTSPTANCANGQYSAGTEVTLMAIANPGFLFLGWSGDVGSRLASFPLTIDRPISLTAFFEDEALQPPETALPGTPP